tara:strand:+ start:21383 stop:22480 length:1098 start_codon:yes stop_codon:yes gene_type:complete
MDKLLIIGAFPSVNNKVYGGVLKSCQILMESVLPEKFNIITLDSTQKSNPAPNFSIRAFYSFVRLFKLMKILLVQRPKVTLIFTSDGFSALEKGLMILICKKLKSKTLIFPRAGNLINQVSKSKFFLKCIKYLFNKSDVFLCQGAKWKSFASKKLHINTQKLKTVGNWTATDSLLSIGNNKYYERNKVNFIFIGWLEEDKGIFELLNATNSLIKKNIEFNLTFVGGGSSEFLAKKFIKKHKMNNNVFFVGWKTTYELNTILESHDVFVLPSWNEGMPNSMIESMAAGLAVIVTSVGVITDFLENYEHAIIIPPKDTKALEKAMINVVNDYDLRIKLSKNGQILAKNKFSTNKEIIKLRDIINNLM